MLNIHCRCVIVSRELTTGGQSRLSRDITIVKQSCQQDTLAISNLWCELMRAIALPLTNSRDKDFFISKCVIAIKKFKHKKKLKIDLYSNTVSDKFTLQKDFSEWQEKYLHPYTGATRTFSLHSEKIFNVQSLLIISPQARDLHIPSHHTGANNFPISLFSHSLLRSFAHLSRSYASRVKEVLVIEVRVVAFPTRTIRYSRQSTTRKRAIEIPSYEFRKWGFTNRTEEERKKDQFNSPSQMLFQRHPLLLREYVAHDTFVHERHLLRHSHINARP